MRKLWYSLLLVILITVGQQQAAAHDGPPLNEVGVAALGFCESTDDYTKVHDEQLPDGTWQTVHGRFQFVQSTWDSAVTAMGGDWLLWKGVPPSQAPPEIQIGVAVFWWSHEGAHTQWPYCHNVAIEAMQGSTPTPLQAFTG